MRCSPSIKSPFLRGVRSGGLGEGESLIGFIMGCRIPLTPFAKGGISANSDRCKEDNSLQRNLHRVETLQKERSTVFVNAPLLKGVRSGGSSNPPTHSIKSAILALLEVFGLGKRNFRVINLLYHLL